MTDNTPRPTLGHGYGHAHPSGFVLPDRADGLHWLRCVDCGREWAEKDSGAYAKGSRVCGGVSR